MFFRLAMLFPSQYIYSYAWSNAKSKYRRKKGTEKLDYDLFKENYTVEEDLGFFWIIDMNIKCDKNKVGLIGSIVSFGLTVGILVFSIMTKYLSYRALIIIFTYLYVLFIFLTTIVDSFEFRLFSLFCCGICRQIWVLWQ